MNVLFILAEALRPPHLSCYGYSKKTTPVIDQLAEEGVLFKNVVAQGSHTIPGVVSCFTGVSAGAHRLEGPKDLLEIENNSF